MLARPALPVVFVVLAACSPGRIASESESESGSGSSGESSEEGPSVETGEDSDDESGDGDPWPGGCHGAGTHVYLDLCSSPDPCDWTACDPGLECLGGQCVAPKPAESCAGLELVDYELPVAFGPGGALLMANIDGIAGDELITAGDGLVEVLRAGELVHSPSLPEGSVRELYPMQLDGDGHVDLLALASASDDVSLLRGDGQGKFQLVPAPLPVSLYRPFPLDFDNDGDHDLVAALAGYLQIYRNDAGVLTWLTQLPVSGWNGVAADLDGDGFVDDALLTHNPSPKVILSEGGQLTVQGPLPEPPRGPYYKSAVGRPIVADLDGDGWVEVFTPLHDNYGRHGGRLWWGLPDGNFAEPRDQFLDEFGSPVAPSFIGFVELDGVAPPELLYSTSGKLGYVRPDLANHLPFGCFSLLLDPVAKNGEPVVGDLDADGQLEIAFGGDVGVEVYTAIPVP